MADKNRYPQIPSTVWWGVRSILNKTPTAAVDDRYLSVHLAVQEAAARAYVNELKSVGILNDENKATELALRWRLDDRYSEAVEELVSVIYPNSLIQVAPPGDADRSKVVRWFKSEGLGQGAAGNKAATYLLISSPTPYEPSTRAVATNAKGDSPKRAAPKQKQERYAAEQSRSDRNSQSSAAPNHPSRDNFPLNVNVQIHISADAGSEQIESIFSAMRRYLYDKNVN